VRIYEHEVIKTKPQREAATCKNNKEKKTNNQTQIERSITHPKISPVPSK
jgi:hypothetical protein